jgi:hypothetical protein
MSKFCSFRITATPGVLHCDVCDLPQPSAYGPADTWRECRPGQRASAPQTKFPCIHRGGQVGTTTCEIPGCRSRIKVYSCTLLQECTLSENVTSKPYCGGCDRREPPTNPLSLEVNR